MAARKLATLLLMMIVAGNGSFSTVNSGSIPLSNPKVVLLDKLPMFVPNPDKDTYVINPVLIRDFLLPDKQNNYIMSDGLAGIDQMSRFLLKNNAGLSAEQAREMAILYFSEARTEGVNHEIAFSQMCLETGFLKYGGIIKPWQNNFCGLGAINKRYKGESFATAREGVRAHIQHLKAYASHESLKNKLADTRFKYVKRGSALQISELAGKWAADPDYALKIKDIRSRLHCQIDNLPFAAY